MLYVGIDWAEKAHRVCIRDDERIHAEIEVPNSAVGAADLLAKIAAIEPDKRNVLFAIEANHGPFIDAILDAGYTIYPLNPKAVERYRDRFRLARAKTDWIDARVLADILRTDRQAHQPLKPDSEETTMLRLLTRDCAELEKTQTMLRNQLRSALLCYFPLATELFSDLASPTALAFLKAYPTHQEARRATPEALEALLRAQRYPRAAKKARELYQALQQAPFAVRPAMSAAKQMLVATLVAQLEVLNAQISSYRKEIDALMQEHPDSAIFTSLPGAGTRLAARMLGELGDDRNRYPGVRVAQARAGTAPVTRQSGKSRVVVFRRACVKPFRETMQLFAFCSTRWCSWARDYYLQKRAAGKKHSEAIRALANVWLKIIFAMWKNRTPYDEARLMAARLTAAQHRTPAQQVA
ncbi:MAG: IS110 family transposase [Firmicutes bacterium]|nr:IS110 family transposase [Bacillota bacterium]